MARVGLMFVLLTLPATNAVRSTKNFLARRGGAISTFPTRMLSSHRNMLQQRKIREISNDEGAVQGLTTVMAENPQTKTMLGRRSSINRPRSFTSNSLAPTLSSKRKSLGPHVEGRKELSMRAFFGGEDGNSDGPVAKLKKIFRDYGAVALIFHSSVWSFTLATSYFLVANGLPIEDHLPLELQEKIPGQAGSLALAYLATEATGPVRTLLTLAAAPVVAKKWQQIRGNGDSTNTPADAEQ